MRYRKIELHNVCDIVDDERGGVRPLRLPSAIMDQINGGAQRMATLGAGCEIRGMLPEGGRAEIVIQALDTNCVPPIATVYHGCFRSRSILVDYEPTEIVVEEPPNLAAMSQISRDRRLPFDPHLVRICLPHLHPVRIVSIEGDLACPAANATPTKALLCYGSSITHGAHAIPPGGTYASQCARALGYDLVNLGVGGSAQMDRAIAEHIASRDDWDVATFEMGINVRGWPCERFREAVETFVGIVTSAHPDKYVFCIDLFTNNGDFEETPSKGVGFREAVDEIVAAIDSPQVVHLDGRSILTDPTGLRVDLVHPSDDGMAEIGRNLAAAISRKLGDDL